MATNMSSTNSKVNQVFEERKDKTIMGLSHLNKKVPEKREEQHIPAQPAEDITKSEFVDSIQEEPSRVEVREQEDDSEQIIHQEIVEQKQTEAQIENPQQREEEIHVQEHNSNREEVKVQEKPAQTPERAPPKKNVAEMAESKIDLSQVFKFST